MLGQLSQSWCRGGMGNYGPPLVPSCNRFGLGLVPSQEKITVRIGVQGKRFAGRVTGKVYAIAVGARKVHLRASLNVICSRIVDAPHKFP